MDIQAIREQIIGYAGLFALAINALLGIFLQFASAKKLAVQAIEDSFKKKEMWNPLL